MIKQHRHAELLLCTNRYLTGAIRHPAHEFERLWPSRSAEAKQEAYRIGQHVLPLLGQYFCGVHWSYTDTKRKTGVPTLPRESVLEYLITYGELVAAAVLMVDPPAEQFMLIACTNMLVRSTRSCAYKTWVPAHIIGDTLAGMVIHVHTYRQAPKGFLVISKHNFADKTTRDQHGCYRPDWWQE